MSDTITAKVYGFIVQPEDNYKCTDIVTHGLKCNRLSNGYLCKLPESSFRNDRKWIVAHTSTISRVHCGGIQPIVFDQLKQDKMLYRKELKELAKRNDLTFTPPLWMTIPGLEFPSQRWPELTFGSFGSFNETGIEYGYAKAGGFYILERVSNLTTKGKY